MTLHRSRLASIIMWEAGKSVLEALADVDEAIDFVNFYVREHIRLKHNLEIQVGSIGVVSVIAPWNFPLAIACGMSVSALASGNTVILKPAEQTSLIIGEFLKLARQSGLTEDHFQVVYGAEEVGIALVNHELVNEVVFTGSVPVGLNIYKSIITQKVSDKYPWKRARLKRVVTEMGGKNAIIISNNCEMDETVSGILYSAFAHAGQKCSACSRVLVHQEIKESFLGRFIEAVKDMKIGSATSFGVDVNPLITVEDQNRVRNIAKEAIEEAQKLGGRVLIDRSQEEHAGAVVGPVVIELPKSALLNNSTWAHKEIFGPVIHIISYKDLDEGIKLFNGTNYALTGGIFAQSQDDIDYLVPKLNCGNIYVNRPNTGARVAIEPFGGFKLSGTGPKAGSVDYIPQFCSLESLKFRKSPWNLQVQDLLHSPKHGVESEYSKDVSVFLSPNELSLDRRKEGLVKFYDHILGSFESFIGKIDELGKERLERVVQYLKSENGDLDRREFTNRVIPGQLNYDVRDTSVGNVLALIKTHHHFTEMLEFLIINLWCGNALMIVVEDQDIFHRLEQLKIFLDQESISPYQLQIAKLPINENSLRKNKNWEHILNYDFGQVWLEESFIASDKTQKSESLSLLMGDSLKKQVPTLRKFHFFEELQLPIDFTLKKLTTPRSLAINIMRHGAPIHLD